MSLSVRSPITRRLLFAIVGVLSLAAISNVKALFAQAQQFDSTYERQLWRELEIWPNLLHNVPSHVFVVDGEDEFGEPFKRSAFYLAADPYASEYAALNLGECTFSQFGDSNAYQFTGSEVPLDRQCRGEGGPEPPAPGALLNPVGLAVDTVMVGTVAQHRVYVADSYNHRIQVFDFAGNVIELPYQMGTGKRGIGAYVSSPSTTYPSGTQGEMLDSPYGIAVDDNDRILVADGGNGRVAVFNSDGSFAFGFDLPDRPVGIGEVSGVVRPNSIALAPGTIALDPAAPGTPAAGGRIVVTDWTHCYVYAFDAKFNLLADLPNEIPAVPQHDACLDPEYLGSTLTEPVRVQRHHGCRHRRHGAHLHHRPRAERGPGVRSRPDARRLDRPARPRDQPRRHP